MALNWFRRVLETNVNSTKRPKRSWRGRPGLELLEDRINPNGGGPQTFFVDSLLDSTVANDGNFTLREAIFEANTNGNPAFTDRIVFAPALRGGTINLVGTQELPAITENVDIIGPGPNGLTIDAGGNKRLVSIEPNVDVEIIGLTLTGGSADDGGAIFNDRGSLTIRNSVLTGNEAEFFGGAIFTLGDAGGGLATLDVFDSVFSGNTAIFGGAIAASGDDVTIENSTLDSNIAVWGGGIHVENASTLLVQGTDITNNIAEALNPGQIAWGGGVSSVFSGVTIAESLIDNNDAIGFAATSSGQDGGDAWGGGLYFGIGGASDINILATTISNNSATGGNGLGSGNGGDGYGGGMFVSQSTQANVSFSTFSGNAANKGTGATGGEGEGGAIWTAGVLFATNNTISGNTATDIGGGVYASGSGFTSLTHTTVTDNTALQGGGLGTGTSATYFLNDSIVAKNNAPTFPDLFGSAQGGNNIVGDGTGSSGLIDGVAGNKIGTPGSPIDPLLGPLADNFGPTLTHALLPGSPAIDMAFGSGEAEDQRGAGRIGIPDIGAFEVVVLPADFDGSFDFDFVVPVPRVIIPMDPAIAIGYDYTVTSGPNISDILLPFVGDDRYTMHLPLPGGGFNPVPFATLDAGIPYDLVAGFNDALGNPIPPQPAGLDGLRILGIEPPPFIDPADPLGFTIGFGFLAAGSGSLTATPIAQDVFVDKAANFDVTNDPDNNGLSNGDTVTWRGDPANPADDVTGLIFGSTAFESVADANNLLAANFHTGLTNVVVAPGFSSFFVEQDRFPDSLAYITIRDVSNPSAPQDIVIPLVGPAGIDVFFEGVNEGDAFDNNNNGRDEVPVEMVELNLTGVDPIIGIVNLGLNPNQRSFGSLEEVTNATPGRLDIPPLEAGNFVVDSFFDVHFQIVLPDIGLTLLGQQPAEVFAEIFSKPPQREIYKHIGPPIQLVDATTGAPVPFLLVHACHAPVPVDFGDAPDPLAGTAGEYPTLVANGGAGHLIVPGGPTLGLTVDPEADGQPTADADGDDLAGPEPDDEDGVGFPVPFITSAGGPSAASVEVVSSAAALLNAWIDFNADGDWDDVGEQIATDTAVLAGLNTITFDVPAGAAVGDTFARFRLDTGGGLTPRGLAADGEVEDYKVTILDGATKPDITIDLGDGGGDYVLDSTGTLRRDGTAIATVPDGSNATLNGGAGDDSLTIDYTGGPREANSIIFNAGQQGATGDSVAFIGTPTGATLDTIRVAYLPAGADGNNLSATLDPDGTPGSGDETTLTADGVEPFSIGGTAANLIFDLSAGAFTATLSDDGPGTSDPDATQDAGFSYIEFSAGAEDTEFLNPTMSLEINDAGGVKTIDVETLDAAWSATLNIDDDGAQDNDVNFIGGTAVSLGAGDLEVDADTIDFMTDVTTTGDATLDAVATILGGAGDTLSADDVTADAGSGIDLDTDVATLDLSVSGAGTIDITETDAVDLLDVDTSAGDITITAGGTLTATDVVAGGTGDVMLTTTAGSDVLVDSVTATGDTIDIDAAGSILETSSDVAADLTADVLDLTAVGGIGTMLDPLEWDTATAPGMGLDATVTAGGIWGTDTMGGMRAAVTASGPAVLATSSGGADMTLELIDSASGPVILDSGGAIVDGNGAAVNIVSTAAELSATADIGTGADPLETELSGTLDATTFGGGVWVADNTFADGLTIGGAAPLPGIMAAGPVMVSTVGPMMVSAPVDSFGASVDLDALSPMIVAAPVTAAGPITITATDDALDPPIPATLFDTLTVAPGIPITSFGSSVTLEAGDDLMLGTGSMITAATTIDIFGDFGNADPGVGSMMTLDGILTAGTTSTVVGDTDMDVILLAPGFGVGGGSLVIDDDGVAGLGAGDADIVDIMAPLILGDAGADLMVTAEAINFFDPTITTADDQVYTGDVLLHVPVTVTGDDIDFGLAGNMLDLDVHDLTVITAAPGSEIISTIISTGGGGGLIKDGPGTLTLLAANTYDGDTDVLAGTLALADGSTNNIASSPVITIAAGAELDVLGLAAGTLTLADLPGAFPGDPQVLAGNGLVDGSVIAAMGTTISPGTSPGILAVDDDVTFDMGSNFDLEVDGLAGPGVAGGHDQIVAAADGTGSVTISDATLNVFGAGVLPFPDVLGTTLVIIDNAGPSAVTGNFVTGAGIPSLPPGTPLPEGTSIPDFMGSGISAVVSYALGDGNDVGLGFGVFLSNGTLFAIGTEMRERFHMWQQGSTIFVTATWGTFTRQFQFPEASVTDINVRMDGDIDTLTMQPEITKPTVIEGGAGNDYIRSGNGDTIIGAHGEFDGGDDYIVTGSGNDTISDTMGNNRIQTFGGNDTVTTGPGNDVITTGDGNDIVDAGEGNNDVRVGNGNDTVTTGDGNDHITAQNGDNVITAGNGDNQIYTNNNTSTDTITSGSGNDRIYAFGQSNTIINAGDGNNTVSDYGGTLNTITTGSGNDNITGGSGADIINAGDGNNTIWANNGNNVITTGSGVDNINSGTGNDIINAGDSNDRISSGDGNDVIDGEGGNDTINSGGGDDLVRGGTGNGNITDTGGNNVLIGNADNDRFYTYGSGRQIIVGGDGTDDVRGGGGDSILIGGTTAYDTNTAGNNAALQAILAEWVTLTPYLTRVNNIRSGGGLTAGNTLDAGTTVLDDGVADVLVGGSGQDWFFASAMDMVFNQRPDEELDVLV